MSMDLEITLDVVICACGVIGLLFALFSAWAVSKVSLGDDGESASERTRINASRDEEALAKIRDISSDISTGARAFLFAEYKIMALYMIGMALVIVIFIGAVGQPLWDNDPLKLGHCEKGKGCAWVDGVFSSIAFLIGSCTSILAGYLGMAIAVYTNSRTTVGARTERYDAPFATAFKGGIVMGFGLTSLGLLNLFITLQLFRAIYYHHDVQPQLAEKALMSAVAPFGLGGSSIALFGRVGGGIFTKAADVGADLVGKVEQNIPEDDPRNPGVIADNVGDNVGDIAGMGSDLFGSFGEATCATLVVSVTSEQLLENFGYLLFPLVVTASGIIVCLITSFMATDIKPPTQQNEIEPALKLQLIISTVLEALVMIPITWACLPKDTFTMDIIFLGYARNVSWWEVYICFLCGLVSGLLIGLVTEYYTSHANKPTQKVAHACLTGAATNIIHGLALGYESCIIPCFCITFSVYVSFSLAGCYGVALAALGILSTMAIGLTIDAYGPISDNAGGIAEMSGLGKNVRDITDALDAAGNTTAAIGKGFAIGSAAFVAVALFGAFQTTVNQVKVGVPVVVNIMDPRVFFGLIWGAMLPYWFSAMTMKSVGKAAMGMVREIQRQFREIPGLLEGKPGVKPDPARCVSIATAASLREMLAPGALVVLTPLIVGIVFGPEALAGLLPGSMVSGVMMALSAANTGGAWDNAKKYIEAGFMPGYGKGTPVHHAAVIGDTVGDPLKDTSGPALNILVKLMAIISVVFAPIMAFQVSNGKITHGPIAGLIFNKAICDQISHACPP